MILPAVSDPDVDRRSPQYMHGIMHEKVMKTLGSNEVNALTQFCLVFIAVRMRCKQGLARA